MEKPQEAVFTFEKLEMLYSLLDHLNNDSIIVLQITFLLIDKSSDCLSPKIVLF